MFSLLLIIFFICFLISSLGISGLFKTFCIFSFFTISNNSISLSLILENMLYAGIVFKILIPGISSTDSNVFFKASIAPPSPPRCFLFCFPFLPKK